MVREKEESKGALINELAELRRQMAVHESILFSNANSNIIAASRNQEVGL
ncbi:Uncharacterised protein [uncultured archaeon]|nr:Uncharacterised protein [uncultured archaeon]